MTLSARNNCFRGGIFLAALSLVLAAWGASAAFAAFPEVAGRAAERAAGIIRLFAGGSAKAHAAGYSAYVPLWAMLGSAVYSLLGIILIYYFFEKTQSPEILFIGLFVISLTFESARIVIPLRAVSHFPAMYLAFAARVLLFGRYFGLFSLFGAGVYAAGLDAQKQQNVFLMIILAAMIIALNVPVDSLVWDSALTLSYGYKTMFLMIELGIFAVTLLTFAITAYTRGSVSYALIGVGVFLVFAGRNILLHSDTLVTLVPGLVILTAGTWLICSRLHLEYLWL